MAVEGPYASASFQLAPERSPEEALGADAAGSLAQNLVTATIGTAVLMVAFTVGPWGLTKAGFFAPAPAAKSAPAESAAQAKPAEPAPAPSTATAGVPAGSAPAVPAAGAPSSAPKSGAGETASKGPQVLERLGIGQEKQADPGVNPLEGRTDDLFKDP